MFKRDYDYTVKYFEKGIKTTIIDTVKASDEKEVEQYLLFKYSNAEIIDISKSDNSFNHFVDDYEKLIKNHLDETFYNRDGSSRRPFEMGMDCAYDMVTKLINRYGYL